MPNLFGRTYIQYFLEHTLNKHIQHNPLSDFSALSMTCTHVFLTVFMIILILHNLHFITAHFSYITAHLCSDNPLF